ncbi:hypothetical protein ACHAXT_000994 [Thalassiosira profunda]
MATTISFSRIEPSADPSSKAAVPLPRSSHGLSALSNGELLLYGGENVARTPITDAAQALWLAKNSGDGWQWLAPKVDGAAPPPRVAHSQAAVGDAVYVYGGRGGIEMGEGALSDMWKLEITNATAKWTEIAPVGSEQPEARSFHKMIAISTDLYVFGGCGASGRLNDLWKFDTQTGKWTSLGSSSLLKGRGGPNILSLAGNKIAIVAGFAGEETNDGHVFSNGSWEEKGMDGLADMRKRSVCAFGCLPDINKCIIFGGEVDPSNRGHEGAGNFERDVVLLDGTTGALSEVVKPKSGEEWPEARGWADATVGEDGTFYVFGGLAGDDVSPVRLGDLWECNVSADQEKEL